MSSLLSQLVDNYGDNSADNHVLSTNQEEAFRLADKMGATVSMPRITGRLEHMNNAPSVNLESHYHFKVPAQANWGHFLCVIYTAK